MSKPSPVHDTQDPLLTIPEIAEADHVNPKTVRRWIKSGELAAYKLGRQWRISERDHRCFRRSAISVGAHGSCCTASAA